MALLVALAVFAVVRSRRDFAGLTRVLNIVSATLAASTSPPPRIPWPAGPASPPARRSKPRGRWPGVPHYYIVLDAYTRGDILEEVFSFDNSAFLSGLRARGFTVADRSYAD